VAGQLTLDRLTVHRWLARHRSGYGAEMGADADVVVVGAGPIGSALAIMLGRSGLRTILIERGRFPRDKPCGEGLLPSGVRVLEELGIPLNHFPTLAGVSYRTPSAGAVSGLFPDGRTGRGTRRIGLDQLLAETAARTPNVEVVLGCELQAISPSPAEVTVGTSNGEIGAGLVVGADGLRSRTARLMGWARPARARRYALVGHLHAPRHEIDRIVITLLGDGEVYLAPTADDEVLVAVLSTKGRLRAEGEPVRTAYERRVHIAHPELAGCQMSDVKGAGPFWTRPSTVAGGRVFLVGDAAGFLDPLTGDGMSAGLVAARSLSAILAAPQAGAAERYRRIEGSQWRRRVFVTRLALAITGSPALAGRAIRGLRRRPAALERLLAMNDGASPLSVSPRDWAALAGI
jgi:menaquinone-9 beta-reductase